MPTYQEIYNKHQSAIARGLTPADQPLEVYARRGAQATGDPSWLDVAEGGAVKNFVRTKNAQLNNAIESGPVDEWSEAAVGRLGDLFGITPEASRDVGRRLPRMALDFVPMVAGGAVGLAVGGPPGAAVGAKIGMGLTGGMSALNAYGESGKLLDAGIGAVSPYVGTKLSQVGTRAILANAAKPGSVLGKMGFTGGTKVTGGALSAAELAEVTASKGFNTLGAEALGKVTVDKLVVDKARDKFLGYVGGELAANAGFTALDIVTQGKDAVLNKDYLFANLVSNIPFMAAEIPGHVGTQVFDRRFNAPVAEKAFKSPAEQRGYETAEMFAGMTSNEVLQRYRGDNLDLADYAKGIGDMMVAIEGQRAKREEISPKFVEDWNAAAAAHNATLGGDALAGKPVDLITPDVASVRRQFVDAPLAKGSTFPVQFVELAQKHKVELDQVDRMVQDAAKRVGRSTTPTQLTESYQKIADEFKLNELFEKPVEARTVEDYRKALGASMTETGAKLIRDFHLVAAGKRAESQAHEAWLQMQTDGGKVAYSPDQQFELTVAYAIANGRAPDFNTAAKKVKEVVEAGGTPKEAVAVGNGALKRKAALFAKQQVFEKKIDDLKAQLDGLPDVIDPADAGNETAQALHHLRKLHTQLTAGVGADAARTFLKKASEVFEPEFAAFSLKDKLDYITQKAKNSNQGKKKVDVSAKEAETEIEKATAQKVKNEAHEKAIDDLGQYEFPWDKALTGLQSDPVFVAGYAKQPLPFANIVHMIEHLTGKTPDPSKVDRKAELKAYGSAPQNYLSRHIQKLSDFDLKEGKLKLAADGPVEIPMPDGPLLQVNQFSEVIANQFEWSSPVERSRFVEALPALSRLFNNSEVVFGVFGELGLQKPKDFTFEHEGDYTFVQQNGKRLEGLTTTNLSGFPKTGAKPDVGPAYFKSRSVAGDGPFGDKAKAEKLLGGKVESVRRIDRVTIPDAVKGKGLGKQLVLNHLAEYPDSVFYNSQASPELTRTFRALERDGLIELKGETAPGAEDRLTVHALRLTEKGKAAKGNLKFAQSHPHSYFAESAFKGIEGFKSRSKIVDMPIADYLKLAAPIVQSLRTTAAKEAFEKGVKWDSIPQLQLESGKVVGHEGRNRAEFLLSRGETTMPVELRDWRLRWSENPVSEYPTELISERGETRVPVSIPEGAYVPKGDDLKFARTPSFRNPTKWTKVYHASDVDWKGNPIIPEGKGSFGYDEGAFFFASSPQTRGGRDLRDFAGALKPRKKFLKEVFVDLGKSITTQELNKRHAAGEFIVDGRELSSREVDQILAKEGYDSMLDLGSDGSFYDARIWDASRVTTENPELKFARVPAGAGFEWNLAEIVGNQVVRKDGTRSTISANGEMDLKGFKLKGGEDTFTDEEIAFYRDLVPEAFRQGFTSEAIRQASSKAQNEVQAGETFSQARDRVLARDFNRPVHKGEEMVNVKKLQEGLGKVGEQVKTTVFESKQSLPETKQRLNELIHTWYDQLNSNAREDYNNTSDTLFSDPTQGRAILRGKNWAPKDIETAVEYAALVNAGENHPDQPQWQSITSGPLDEGYFELSVSLPGKTLHSGQHQPFPNNTIVHSRVRIVKRADGTKVGLVEEVQGDWAQAVRKEKQYNSTQEAFDNAPEDFRQQRQGRPSPKDHPTLPVHQAIGLKATIKELQKRGITEMFVVDGETAMMTEGHDKKAYMHPDELEKMADTFEAAGKGQVTTKGQDLYFWANEDKVNPLAVLHQTSYGYEIESNQGNLLFKPLDPSQGGGMRLAYDTTMPSIMKKLVGEGSVEDFGVHKNASQNSKLPWVLDNPDGIRETYATQEAALQGKARAEAQGYKGMRAYLDGSPVFRTPSGTPKTNITGLTFDISNPSSRTSSLFAKSQGTIFGAASQKAKQIFLNSPAFRKLDPTDQLTFIFAHEHAHVSYSKAKAGEYGPEAKAHLDRAEAWVKQASPEAKAEVEDVIRELALPKGMDLKEIEGVLRNPDGEEWMANTHAMLAVGALSSPHPKEMFAFLPRPVRDFLDWSVGTMQRLVKGVKIWAKLGFSVEKFQQVSTMEKYFDSVRRSFRQAEFDAAEAVKFMELGNPAMRQSQAEEFVFAMDDPHGRPQMWTEPKQWFDLTWQKWTLGMSSLGRMFPTLQPAIDAVRFGGSMKSDLTASVMKIMHGKVDAHSKVKVDEEGPLNRVVKSPPLNALFNALTQHMEVEKVNLLSVEAGPDGKAVFTWKDDAFTPELRGRLKQFKSESQKALLEATTNFQRANIQEQKVLVTVEGGKSESLIAQTLAALESQRTKAGFEMAHQRAENLYQGLRDKDQVKVAEALKGLTSDEAEVALGMATIHVEDNVALAEFYEKSPSYRSFRRFKEFRQRITKGEHRDLIDADSSTELKKALQKYLDNGWVLDGPPLPPRDKKGKEAFHVNDEVRTILERKEKRIMEFLEGANIPDDVKVDLGKQMNFAGELAQQINAQSLYKPGANRKLVGDLSRFDVLDQFMHSVPASISAAVNARMNARVNFELRHPDLLMQRTQKDQFLALYEQSKDPDHPVMRELMRANAAWHIGLNLPGHLAEGFQPFISHLPELKAQGLSTWKALKSLKNANKEVFRMYSAMAKEKIWKPESVEVHIAGKNRVDFAKEDGTTRTYDGLPAVWYRANVKHVGHEHALEVMDMLADNISRVQRAPLAELFEAVGQEQRKLNDLMEGNKVRSAADHLLTPMHKYAQVTMGLYANFTQHNGLIALIPAYRQGRANGKDHAEAKLEAARFDLAVNNSGGRLERPEMYGQLGHAGPAIYALSTFVRGRFGQLATYYKHGWSQQFSGEGAGMTPTQRANAKAAFKTMILAQLGFAGVLGLPFVGAGIALMEEMLGEDLRGKMLIAMGEALGDPILTRVASHGAMSAFAESAGIPADLHSRFALNGFLGVNSYDGVSAKSFMGSMASMANSLWNMGGSLARGEGPVNALARGGPGGVKRFAEALTDQFRQDNPEMNMFSSALGFRSGDMVKRKEWEAIARKQELEASSKKKLAAAEVQKAMKMGPLAARKKLMEEAVKLLPETRNPQERQEALKGIVQGLVQRVTSLAEDAEAPRDYQATVSNSIRPQAMAAARAMGMPQSEPMELARALAGNRARGMLGQTVSQAPVRNAAKRQALWDPFNVGF